MSLILMRPYSSDKDKNNYSTYNSAMKRLFTLKEKGYSLFISWYQCPDCGLVLTRHSGEDSLFQKM